MSAFEPLPVLGTSVHEDALGNPPLLMEATFMPRRRSDIRPEAARFVGWRGQWQALWRISEDEGGDFVGQMMWMPRDGWPWFGWAPD